MTDEPTQPLQFGTNGIALRMEVIDEALDRYMADLQRELLKHLTEPWEFTDRNPMPTVVVWPPLDTLIALPARVRRAPTEARGRCRYALNVLRHGVPNYADDY